MKAAAPAAAEEVAEEDDLELVAVITAAIAASREHLLTDLSSVQLKTQ